MTDWDDRGLKTKDWEDWWLNFENLPQNLWICQILKICHKIYEFATQIINLPQIYLTYISVKAYGRLSPIQAIR